jgi:hypothetical protein
MLRILQPRAVTIVYGLQFSIEVGTHHIYHHIHIMNGLIKLDINCLNQFREAILHFGVE